MADQDLAGIGGILQAACQVHFATDDGVVHARAGAEVADRAVTGVQAHADLQRLVDALAAPLLAQDLHVLAHGDGHGDRGHGVLLGALAVGVAKEHHHAVTDELVDGATVFDGDLRHLVEVVVEHVGEGFGLEFFGQLGEALDVGEEHRDLLALGAQGDVLLAGEDGFPDLGREVFGQVVRQDRRLFLLALEIVVDLDEALALAMQEVAGAPEVQHGAHHAGDRHQQRTGEVDTLEEGGAAQRRGAGGEQQAQAEQARATAQHAGIAEHEQQHQGGHQREAQHHRRHADMDGVQGGEDDIGLGAAIASELETQGLGHMGVEQGIGDQPQAHRIGLGVVPGGDAGGGDQIGEYPGVVDAQAVTGRSEEPVERKLHLSGPFRKRREVGITPFATMKAAGFSSIRDLSRPPR